ncbi:unnamed protein product [Clonostachys rosea f. rosea IK726]|uniref:Uncharacterized protein n=1 Tax=Clonostachys rosea f. rosea IK726 TaxID=1349383 RepID=A0ACA9U456_BIOOC|nr:unnamed protein product [Clonostachys rosea f. rosea IK726]
MPLFGSELSDQSLYGTAFSVGVLVHLSVFRLGEWDGVPGRIAAFFAAVYAISSVASIYALSEDYGGASVVLMNVSALFLTLLLGLFASMLIYRTGFHRLRLFPGPRLARISSIYATRMAMKRLKYFDEVDQLHKLYGDFVRIGPNHLSVAHPAAVQAVHSSSSRCLKGPWYNTQLPAVSLLTSRDPHEHARRRKTWDNGLSFKAIRTYEANIAKCTLQLISNVEASLGRNIDMSHHFTLYTFDVMGTLAFAKDFKMLESKELHPIFKFLHESMLSVVIFGHAMWFLTFLNNIPGLASPMKRLNAWADQQIEDQISDKPDTPNVFSWLLRDYMMLPNPTPQHRMNLQADASLIVVAGSDTTASTLTCLLFELTKHPDVYRKLQNEVDAHLSDSKELQNDSLIGMEYLQACIDESMRMHPIVPGGVQRHTPPQGLRVGDTFIPGDVIIQVPMHTVNYDERSFPQAGQFIPERWTSRPDLVTDDSCFTPFLAGKYSCPGKQLALLEVRQVIYEIARRYDISFFEPKTRLSFPEDIIDGFSLHCPKLELVFSSRSTH